ncbi:zinc uptake protein ZrgA [Tropicibacter oceani]|uniref:DUF2796 domain-containing protein n=1 Tax=Tropicibacter oceani TaxID=3058420 RepID=A0ABY8QF16_9RHOB|nr:DUF2796 domain-containing protein [Tropicibacter oceani]WGW03217.1 DUF2796 domain-containing protein [Tropicibacter oceani]
MKPILLTLAAATVATAAAAQDTREMDAHVHGVSTAEIALEHGTLVINIEAPGMDVVGFEYAATSAQDKDAVEAAIRTLLTPENILTLPQDADCRLTEVLAHLHGADHKDDDHPETMADDDHGHEDHDDHSEHDDHDEHAEDAQHSAFHARYIFACETEDALTSIGFPFFERFENAREIRAQYVTETGAGQAGITRDASELALD